MIKPPRTIPALPVAASAAVLGLLCASGCAVYEDPMRPQGYGPARSEVYSYAEPGVVSVDVEPPLYEPSPIAVPWAPPPMLREFPPPMPFPGAVWVGGYWVWQGDWVWATGRWAPPPRPDYAWVQPYYEHRDGMVIFITGHWCPPGVAFVPPPRGMRMPVMAASPGARRGYAPVGPPGVFLPPPPGSRPGLIVPAPMGTPPAVMRGAPPLVNGGMRVQNTANDPRQGGARPSTRPFTEEAAPLAAPPRQRSEQALQPQSPAPRSAPWWRGGSRQQVPAQEQAQERDRGAPRNEGWRSRDRNQEIPQERGQERVPTEAQRRPFQSAPVQLAPAPTRPPNDSAQQQPRREEGPRRFMGQPRAGDKDKKDGNKGE